MKKEKKPKVPEGPLCPKCGLHKGWEGPTYQRGTQVEIKRVRSSTNAFLNDTVETVESLVYACKGCGYRRHEACKDL